MNKLRYTVEWWIVRVTPLMCATISILGLLGIETLFKHSVNLGYTIAIFYTVLVIYWLIRLYDFIIKDLKRIEDKLHHLKERNNG